MDMGKKWDKILEAILVRFEDKTQEHEDLSLTGFVGSIYSSNIRDAFPFASNTWGMKIISSNISVSASIFWILLITFVVSLAIQQFQRYMRRKVDQDTLTKQITDLKSVLGTMPPVDFMDALSKAIQDCDNYVTEQKAISEYPIPEGDDDTKRAIVLARDRRNQARFILSNMIALANQWDNTLISGPHGAIYRGNIMLFRSREELAKLNNFEASNLFSHTKFIVASDAKTAFESVDGILDLDLLMTYRDTELHRIM